LVKFLGKNAGEIATQIHHSFLVGFLRQHNTYRIISICVVLPKVTKASKAIVTIASMIVTVTGFFAKSFVDVNKA
jgi:hypothetical protein